jgi:F-type H+-transporting ATPase subunit O
MFKYFSRLTAYSNFLKPQTRLLMKQNYFFSSEKSDFEIKSVPGNKPPVKEENPPSRYAAVLFSAASKREALYLVLEDIKYIKELINKCDAFRNFLVNLALKRNEQMQVFDALGGEKTFNKLTINFLHTLIDNKRLDSLPKIVDKYIDFYKILNKEENIRIISATELEQSEQDKVIEALKKSHVGINFTVKYEVDPTILGGLQMYSGNNFMDCSLLSRVQKIKSELAKMSV